MQLLQKHVQLLQVLAKGNCSGIIISEAYLN